MTPRPTLPLVSLALCTALFLPSCLFGTKEHTETTGTLVDDTTFERIEPGNSMEFVRQLLGPPTRKIDTDEEQGGIWEWKYQKVTKKSGSIFLIFASSKREQFDTAVFVEFEDDVVTRTWHGATTNSSTSE
jgi:outer membrane protein assembly factor BamE (lipoprotein component of BamABCDE complex)